MFWSVRVLGWCCTLNCTEDFNIFSTIYTIQDFNLVNVPRPDTHFPITFDFDLISSSDEVIPSDRLIGLSLAAIEALCTVTGVFNDLTVFALRKPGHTRRTDGKYKSGRN